MTDELSDIEVGIRALPPADLARLRPYVVNLSQGSFSSDGQYASSAADVDAIFDQHLPRFVEAAQRPVPLLIWAHGGLVNEESGLRIAQGQVDWWLRNGVYPLHFVWESGLMDALGQARGPLAAGRRDLWDHTTDPLLEEAIRPLGRRAWAAMKYSAQRASDHGGGARYLARRLSEFCAADPNAVALHAVGHSAGSIFHAHFLTAARSEGVPSFETLQYLAPAIRANEFKRLVAPTVGEYVQALTMYTMRRELERADSCMQAYRKSLLYLIKHALEAERDTPILGLEDTIVGDPELGSFFGLRGGGGRRSEAVWSRTHADAAPGSRSQATSHGGFDNDASTMDSVATRVLRGRKATPFPRGAVDQARHLYEGVGGSGAAASPSRPSAVTPLPGVAGTRRALCVGIDDYPAPHALAGCKADARAWSAMLGSLGFSVTELLDADATRQGILDALGTLVAGARAGDVVVLQYSGHGIEVPDLGGDEAGGSNGDRDEAMCPVDFADGQLLIDDDLRQVAAQLPEASLLTVFADCCHSGTLMRAFVDLPRSPSVRTLVDLHADVRPRYMRLTLDLADAFRQARSFRGRDAANDVPRARPAVLFSACRDYEVAYERDGQGDFTRHCMSVLSKGVSGLTNAEFIDKVLREFGEGSQQNPELDLADLFGPQPFLQTAQAIAGRGAANGMAGAEAIAPGAGRRASGAAQLLGGLG